MNNVAPTATLGTNSGVTYGDAATANLTAAFDPSTADTTALFHYAFSIDTDTTGTATYANSGTSSSTDFGILTAGAHTVYSRIIDKDDGFTPYSVTLTVNKATLTTIVTANGGTYNGSPFPYSTVQATGAGGLNDTNPSNFTFLYSGTGSTVYSSATAPTNSGTYTVTAI